MRFVSHILMITFVFLVGCSSDSKDPVLTSPGFGITKSEVSRSISETEIPVYLKYDEPVKGIQFTLDWDPDQADVGQPVINATNPGFTVSSKSAPGGRMKVLIFSMQGDVFDLTDPEVFRLPIKITDENCTEFNLRFEDAVFAGPSAASYDIPVSHAKFKVVK